MQMHFIPSGLDFADPRTVPNFIQRGTTAIRSTHHHDRCLFGKVFADEKAPDIAKVQIVENFGIGEGFVRIMAFPTSRQPHHQSHAGAIGFKFRRNGSMKSELNPSIVIPIRGVVEAEEPLQPPSGMNHIHTFLVDHICCAYALRPVQDFADRSDTMTQQLLPVAERFDSLSEDFGARSGEKEMRSGTTIGFGEKGGGGSVGAHHIHISGARGAHGDGGDRRIHHNTNMAEEQIDYERLDNRTIRLAVRRVALGKYTPGLKYWKVSGVSDMSNLFSTMHVGWRAEVPILSKRFWGLRRNDLRRWDVSKVTQFSRMFYGQRWFNQPLGEWDVGEAVEMEGMFSSTSFNHPLGGWKVAKVENFTGMFSNAVGFNEARSLGEWTLHPNAKLECMFWDCVGMTVAPEAWLTRMPYGLIIQRASNVFKGTPVLESVMKERGEQRETTISIKMLLSHRPAKSLSIEVMIEVCEGTSLLAVCEDALYQPLFLLEKNDVLSLVSPSQMMEPRITVQYPFFVDKCDIVGDFAYLKRRVGENEMELTRVQLSTGEMTIPLKVTGFLIMNAYAETLFLASPDHLYIITTSGELHSRPVSFGKTPPADITHYPYGNLQYAWKTESAWVLADGTGSFVDRLYHPSLPVYVTGLDHYIMPGVQFVSKLFVMDMDGKQHLLTKPFREVKGVDGHGALWGNNNEGQMMSIVWSKNKVEVHCNQTHLFSPKLVKLYRHGMLVQYGNQQTYFTPRPWMTLRDNHPPTKFVTEHWTVTKHLNNQIEFHKI